LNLELFKAENGKGTTVSNPAAPDFIRYLAAKKGLDDRSLNRQVWDHLQQGLRDRPGAAPLRVLEVGCGIGTMVERLLERGVLTRAVYTGIDRDPECIRAAVERLQAYAAAHQIPLSLEAGGTMQVTTPAPDVRIALEAADLGHFLAQQPENVALDLLVAHAFLDLVDLAAVLPPLLARLAPGGRFYFSLNFDGATILEPLIDPDLDALIETLYHRTMDTRRHRGRPAGSSHTGRRLFGHLQAAGARLIAAGSSDWVVFSGPDGYPGDEAFLLHFIIDTIGRALDGHPELDRSHFQAWINQRHRQIEARELIYIAHQLDFLGYIGEKGKGR
jgi:SAM-dependent methyltransferase